MLHLLSIHKKKLKVAIIISILIAIKVFCFMFLNDKTQPYTCLIPRVSCHQFYYTWVCKKM